MKHRPEFAQKRVVPSQLVPSHLRRCPYQKSRRGRRKLKSRYNAICNVSPSKQLHLGFGQYRFVVEAIGGQITSPREERCGV